MKDTDEHAKNEKLLTANFYKATGKKSENMRILYYDNAKIRHMERMFDLFRALFRTR